MLSVTEAAKRLSISEEELLNKEVLRLKLIIAEQQIEIQTLKNKMQETKLA